MESKSFEELELLKHSVERIVLIHTFDISKLRASETCHNLVILLLVDLLHIGLIDVVNTE